MRTVRSPIAAALGYSGVLLLLWGCGSSTGPAGAKAPAASGDKPPLPKIDARVVQVELIRWPRLVRAQGSLVADEVAVIGAKVPGRVADVHVDLGQEVKTGTELIELDREDLRLQIAQAKAQLQQSRASVGLPVDAAIESLNPLNAPPVREAQAVLDEAQSKRSRLERLYGQKAVTDTEWQEAVAAEKVATAQLASATNAVNEKIALIHVRIAELALAEQRYADAAMPAPFDGLVLERHVAPGSFVQTGQAVVTLVRTNPLRFQGTLPERFAHSVQLGQEVRLHLADAVEPCRSQIARISPSLDRNSRALLFEADIDNAAGRLRAGLFVEADIVIDDDQTALAVPESALIEFAGTEKVWKLSAGISAEQLVETGVRRGGLVEIVSGLQAGELILKAGAAGKAAEVSISATELVTPLPEDAVADAEPPSTMPVDGPNAAGP